MSPALFTKISAKSDLLKRQGDGSTLCDEPCSLLISQPCSQEADLNECGCQIAVMDGPACLSCLSSNPAATLANGGAWEPGNIQSVVSQCQDYLDNLAGGGVITGTTGGVTSVQTAVDSMITSPITEPVIIVSDVTSAVTIFDSSPVITNGGGTVTQVATVTATGRTATVTAAASVTKVSTTARAASTTEASSSQASYGDRNEAPLGNVLLALIFVLTLMMYQRRG